MAAKRVRGRASCSGNHLMTVFFASRSSYPSKAGSIRLSRLAVAMAMTGVLTACAVGPDYHRPAITVGQDYKAVETDTVNPGWVRAQAQDDALRPDWWTLFNDQTLTRMIENLLDANFDLARAEALYRQSQATLRATRAGFFPTLGV